jgi:hypothetical protein
MDQGKVAKSDFQGVIFSAVAQLLVCLLHTGMLLNEAHCRHQHMNTLELDSAANE